MIKILLVEDDIALSYGIEYALKRENFSVVTSKTLEEAKKKLDLSIDLVLLDIMLPDGNGYDFCKEIRGLNDVPVIFMTALEEEANVVLGLDLGGDDYIIKPVRIKELVSRINAVLRRRQKGAFSEKLQRIISGDIIIEPLKCKVWLKDKELSLTNIEYKLLLLFIENRGIVLSRNLLLDRLWDVNGNFVDSKTLNVYVKRLREKIEENEVNSRYIETIRGVGYKWSQEVSDDKISIK